jgi:hypothetical protein
MIFLHCRPAPRAGFFPGPEAGGEGSIWVGGWPAKLALAIGVESAYQVPHERAPDTAPAETDWGCAGVLNRLSEI